MYEYKKKKGIFKKIITIIFLIMLSSSLTIFIYNMYINIDVYSQEENSKINEGVRLSQTINEKNNKEQNITDVLEKTIKCVVGISKIKNTGNSIFLNNSTQELGLGTGIIITDNRIYTYKFTCCWK